MYIYDLGPNGNNSIGRVGGAPCTSPVGSFAPNGYGLYDMAGNVEEWCWDWWVPLTGGTDPHGDGNGNSTIRVTRGGDWSGLAGLACCACRCPQLFGSTVVSETTGFRAVCPKKTTTEGEAVEIKEETGKVNQEPLQFKRKISEQSISQENNDSSVQEKRNTLTLTRFMQMHGIKNANDSAQMMQLAQYLTGFRGSTQFQSMMDALEKMVQTGKVYGMSAQETFKLQESSIKMGSGRSFQEYRMLSPQ